MRWLVVMLFSCGAREPWCKTPCGLTVLTESRGPLQYACDDYSRVETAAVQETPLPVCAALKGSVAWEHGGFSSELRGRMVAGWAECHLTRFHYHTGDGFIFPDKDPNFPRPLWYTAFVHEMMHLAQNCDSPPPTDMGLDSDHSNWSRDGIYNAIDRANLKAGDPTWKP